MFLNDKQVIVGVNRTLQQVGATPKWNKKNLQWVITHHTSECTRQHRIDLQMTFVSSERIIRVDDVIKYKGMCSFGFNVEFQISGKLAGKIVQDGFTFQLFINGKSYSDCAKEHYQYQPPTIPFNYKDQIRDTPKLQQSENIKQKVVKSEIKYQALKSGDKMVDKSKTNAVVSQQKKSVQVALKDSQDELMRIMIQQKKRRKKAQKQLMH